MRAYSKPKPAVSRRPGHLLDPFLQLLAQGRQQRGGRRPGQRRQHDVHQRADVQRIQQHPQPQRGDQRPLLATRPCAGRCGGRRRHGRTPAENGPPPAPARAAARRRPPRIPSGASDPDASSKLGQRAHPRSQRVRCAHLQRQLERTAQAHATAPRPGAGRARRPGGRRSAPAALQIIDHRRRQRGVAGMHPIVRQRHRPLQIEAETQRLQRRRRSATGPRWCTSARPARPRATAAAAAGRRPRSRRRLRPCPARRMPSGSRSSGVLNRYTAALPSSTSFVRAAAAGPAPGQAGAAPCRRQRQLTHARRQPGIVQRGVRQASSQLLEIADRQRHAHP